MTYQSVDALQKALSQDVFASTNAPKKAAGRALGTLVELITFYMIRDWGLEPNLAIERGLPEYGNDKISHNVEFTLHSTINTTEATLPDDDKSVTATSILKQLRISGTDLKITAKNNPDGYVRKTRSLRVKNVLRHGTIFAEKPGSFWVAYMVGNSDKFQASQLNERPFAMFECKRVGIEEGQKKGPQTIEKAKQGAYVARSVSALQRVSRSDGSVSAVVEDADKNLILHPNYYEFLRKAIDNQDAHALKNIVLTIGVVSNHGNWFDHTSGEHNKEIKVLAQSYDWLLFLTDNALAEFIEDVIHGTDENLAPVRAAFEASFGRTSGSTSFTKVTIDQDADQALTAYFAETQPWERWFNVIAPAPSLEAQAAIIDVSLDEAPGAAGSEVPAIRLEELQKDLLALQEMTKGKDN